MKEENEVEYEWKVFLETIKDSIFDEFENVYVSNVNPQKIMAFRPKENMDGTLVL